jgi:predicted aconitase with swiveling domain
MYPFCPFLSEPDDIITIGALVATELYGVAIPVVVASADAFHAIRNSEALSLIP